MNELAPLFQKFKVATGCDAVLWSQADPRSPISVVCGQVPADPPAVVALIGLENGAAQVETPIGPLFVAAAPGPRRAWVAVGPCQESEANARGYVLFLAALVGHFVHTSLEVEHAAHELAERYEEINLLYSTSEILGRTVTLEEAANQILHEISETVGARRAAILTHDRVTDTLQVVTAIGFDPLRAAPIAVDDGQCVSARVFREQRAAIVEAGESECAAEFYRHGAMLSVPIQYTYPGQRSIPLGVVNLSERRTGESFTSGDEKLVSAIASQIGTAIQNARLVRASLSQQRLQHEMQLAQDLQMKLLPAPSMVAPEAQVAAQVVPAESVGGDFYHLFRLGDGKTGLMIGDVSSHGYRAALIMALLMSAASIHAQTTADPVEMLLALMTSLADELTATEMHVSVFYAVIDSRKGRMRYANAGHPHAFVLAEGGGVDRLSAQVPPLGLGDTAADTLRRTWKPVERPWLTGRDLLLLFTDGVSDARNRNDQRLGERRLVELVKGARHLQPKDILERAFVMLTAHAGDAPRRDDLTLVVARS
ncbi:MAG: GAF domain-containing SpoIIE family protein phosphatase [Gemmatimonadaceae bacterium]